MKSRGFILTLLGVAFVFFGCGQEEPMSPQVAQGEQGTMLAKPAIQQREVVRLFMTRAIREMIIDPGERTVIDGVVSIKDKITQFELTGPDIEGTAITRLRRAQIVQRTGRGSGHGDFAFGVSELFGKPAKCIYQGKFDVQFENWAKRGNFQGQDLDISSTIVGDFSSYVDTELELEGRIVDRVE